MQFGRTAIISYLFGYIIRDLQRSLEAFQSSGAMDGLILAMVYPP